MSNFEQPSFQRAFVALSFVAGRRDAELLEPFTLVSEDARLLAQRLAHPARERRAEVLARELSRIALALEARRVT